jgi:hypothetical protein
LTIVASHDLGEQGTLRSKPLLVDWRWYYHLPSLAFWALALVPLLVLRGNHRPQAWAILAPLLAVVVGSRMLTTMLFLSPGASEPFSIFCGTFATAWAIVWLLGPWLDDVPGVVAFLLAGLVMFLVGLLAYLACFGLAWNKSSVPLILFYAFAALGLLVPMALSRWSCRTLFSPARFMGRLFLWMMAVLVGLIAPLFLLAVVLSMAADGARQIGFFALIGVLMVGFYGTFTAVFVYLLNLPFMALAFRTKFYRQRFCRVLRLVDVADPRD